VRRALPSSANIKRGEFMSNHKHRKNIRDEKNYDLNKISNMINNMDKNQIQDILSNLNIDNNVLNEVDLNSTGNDRGLLLLNTIKPYLNKDRKKALEKIEKIYAASRMVGKNI
jgi:histidyl-tRNA synthetase